MQPSLVEVNASAGAINLLVIDDDDAVRHSIASYLKDSGYKVDEADSGEAGLQLMTAAVPDLVLCDLRMPELDGIHVLKVIAENYPYIPVIVISGVGVMSDVVEALRLGASDYLIKPILDLEVLEHAIARSLERYSLRKQNREYRQQLEQANTDLKANLAVLQQDQQAGLQVQMKMLPVTPQHIRHFRFRHKIIPSIFLSGDFVEYVTVGEDYVILFMADVSGHGASSAFVTVLLKNLTARMRSEYNRAQRQTILNPNEFLEKANAELLGTQLGKHATVFFAVVNMQENSFSYSVAGQLPLPLLVCDGVARYLEGSGPPIGLFEDTDYQVTEIVLPEQFRIMMFSDGILEVLPLESLVEKEQLLLDSAADLPSDLDEALIQLGVDVNTAYPDDIALLVLDKE